MYIYIYSRKVLERENELRDPIGSSCQNNMESKNEYYIPDNVHLSRRGLKFLVTVINHAMRTELPSPASFTRSVDRSRKNRAAIHRTDRARTMENNRVPKKNCTTKTGNLTKSRWRTERRKNFQEGAQSRPVFCTSLVAGTLQTLARERTPSDYRIARRWAIDQAGRATANSANSANCDQCDRSVASCSALVGSNRATTAERGTAPDFDVSICERLLCVRTGCEGLRRSAEKTTRISHLHQCITLAHTGGGKRLSVSSSCCVLSFVHFGVRNALSIISSLLFSKY